MTAGAALLSIPTMNSDLAQQVGNFDTVAQALDYAAKGETGIVIYGSTGNVEHAMSYKILRNQAISTGLKLQSLGFVRGARICIVAETCPEFFYHFYGCQYVGLIPCPLPYTMYLGGKDAYINRIAALARAAQADLICLPNNLVSLIELIEAATNIKTMTFDASAQLAETGILAPLAADELAYIQFSSGSTSQPKGIAVSQASLASNVNGILQECIGITLTDRAFSWLPLYHDMGMVGFSIAPLFAQVSTDYLTASTFARRPVLWLDLMSQNRSTITYAPSFGYQLAERRYKKSDTPLDLSALRLAGIGGDMIQAHILQSFGDALANTGFQMSAFTPSYGMAESTLLISYSRGLSVELVDRKSLETMKRAIPVTDEKHQQDAKALVICGKPLNGHDIIVVDEAGERLSEREVGHILVRGPSIGPSIMAGYFNAPEQKTSTARKSDFFDSGDIGYLTNGQIVVTGRFKEMIALNGRNIWPQDLELTIANIPEIQIGNVAAFSVEEINETKIIILVECHQSDVELSKSIRLKCASAIHSTSGISPQIYLIAPRMLPFTSSGKLSRMHSRDMFLKGDIKLHDPA